jgi:hypothetical protein
LVTTGRGAGECYGGTMLVSPSQQLELSCNRCPSDGVPERMKFVWRKADTLPKEKREVAPKVLGAIGPVIQRRFRLSALLLWLASLFTCDTDAKQAVFKVFLLARNC